MGLDVFWEQRNLGWVNMFGQTWKKSSKCKIISGFFLSKDLQEMLFPWYLELSILFLLENPSNTKRQGGGKLFIVHKKVWKKTVL